MTSLAVKHQPTIEKLEPVAAGVAWSLARCLDYEDIAFQYGLTVEQVAKIARGNLVKKRVKELVKEIDLKVVEETAANPVTQYLKGKSLKAAQSLVKEVENEDREMGASASTRISASKEVLALAGFKPETQAKALSQVIMISAEKVQLGQSIIEKTLSDVPDFVDG